MKVIVFGATGMVGQGVLQECIESAEVKNVLVVGRTKGPLVSAKVADIVPADMYEYTSLEPQLQGYDACFFCLGVSSVGMSEADYTRVTYGLALAAAKTLVKLNPQMTFCFVSGVGTDSTEKGHSMWARVKGKTENALKALPFKAVYLFRPGYIHPLKGARSKAALNRAFYTVLTPFYPLWKRLLPDGVTTTENVGKAMLQVVKSGYATPVLTPRDINILAGARKPEHDLETPR